MQNRFRSRTAWMAVITLVLFIAKTYFKVEIQNVDMLVQLLMGVMVAVGVFNDPTNKEGY